MLTVLPGTLVLSTPARHTTGSSGQITYSIVSGNENGAFRIQADSGTWQGRTGVGWGVLRKNLSLQRGGQGSPPRRPFSRPGNTEVPVEKEPSCPFGALTGSGPQTGQRPESLACIHIRRFRSTTHHKNPCQQDLSHLSIHPLRNQEVFAYLCPVLGSEFHHSLRTLIITPTFSDGFYFSLMLLLSHSATNVQLHIKSACLQSSPLASPINISPEVL